MNALPRVLVISPVKFNQQTGSGVTMSNLFRGWPINSIAQIHTENWTTPDIEVCQQYYHLPYNKIRQQSFVLTAKESLQQLINYLSHRQQTLFGHFAHRKSLLNWCRKFAPDLIYARPLDRPSFTIWLPYWISQQLNIPYVTRILDDWPSRHQNDPVFIRRFYWQIYLHKIFNNLLKNAAINVGISNEMCEAFHERYQSRFIAYHNCIDFSSWHPGKQIYDSKDFFNILYMGSIKADKELHSLIDLKEVILQLNRQQKQVHLTIYGPERYAQSAIDYLEVPPIIKYGGFFKSADKYNMLKDADLLFLPINFDHSSTAYLGYSFQTKVPEYMASGTPVLIYGPTENPNVQYAQNYQWAAIVDQRDRKLLMSTINELITNLDKRKYLGQKARRLALQNHDAENIRPAFQKMLRDIVVHKPTH